MAGTSFHCRWLPLSRGRRDHVRFFYTFFFMIDGTQYAYLPAYINKRKYIYTCTCTYTTRPGERQSLRRVYDRFRVITLISTRRYTSYNTRIAGRLEGKITHNRRSLCSTAIRRGENQNCGNADVKTFTVYSHVTARCRFFPGNRLNSTGVCVYTK